MDKYKLHWLLAAFIIAMSGNVAAQVTIDGSRSAYAITGISPEDYSGITYLEGNHYAVVSDAKGKDGFYIFTINTKSDGTIASVTRSDFYGSSGSRNCEGITYHSGRKTVFISGEEDQQILEYNMDGTKTGSKLTIPDIFRYATYNYGFESVGYNSHTGLFWTTSESTLTVDGPQASYEPSNRNVHNLLRLQSFDESLQPAAQYAYMMDLPESTSSTAYLYAFGVSDMTALDDGRLLVLEREFYVGSGFDVINSWVKNKIYLVDPRQATDVGNVSDLRTVDSSKFLAKQKLWELKTGIADIANYEGMCLGPSKGNGSFPLFLVNDSQSGYAGILKEYVLPLIINGLPLPTPPMALPDLKVAENCIYPNPVGEVLHISANGKWQTANEVRIIDVNGRVMWEQKMPSSSMDIDTSHWTKGIYFVNVSTEDGNFTEKIIKK